MEQIVDTHELTSQFVLYLSLLAYLWSVLCFIAKSGVNFPTKTRSVLNFGDRGLKAKWLRFCGLLSITRFYKIGSGP